MEEIIDESFFDNRECEESFYVIDSGSVYKRIKAAYDIRSRYLHAGKSIEYWLSILRHVGAETTPGRPVIDDADERKLIERTPTLIGLERMVHYCFYKSLKSLIPT